MRGAAIYRRQIGRYGETITLNRTAGNTSVRARIRHRIEAELDGFKYEELAAVLLAEDLSGLSPAPREGDVLGVGSETFVIQNVDGLKRRVAGVTLAYDVIAHLATTLTFTHPTTSATVHIAAVYATQKSESDNLKASVTSTRPRYKIRLFELTARDLTPANLDQMTVTVDGITYEVSSSAPVPSKTAAGMEIALNLIVPRP